MRRQSAISTQQSAKNKINTKTKGPSPQSHCMEQTQRTQRKANKINNKHQRPLTTARQSRNQKRNIHHGGTETRRNPKARVNSQSQNLNTEDTEKLSEDAESRRLPNKILRGMRI